MSTNRPFIVIAILLVCALSWAQQPQQPAEPDEGETPDILAIVDGTAVNSDELWWYMEQTAAGRLLDDFIVRHLIMREAEREGVKVGTPQVDEALEGVRGQYPSAVAFRRWLHQTGQTEKGLRMQLQQDLLVEALLNKRMGLTDEGVREYYDTHLAEFTEPARVHLLDIVTLTVHDAFMASERLAAGEDFAAVAREMSHDPTAQEGGDRGWIEPDDVLCENVAEVVFAMSEGQISDPVDCGDHFHVFLAREVEPKRQIPFEVAEPTVVERIHEVRGISEELYIALLKRRAQIDVRWDAAEYLADVYKDERAIKVVVDGERLELAVPPVLLASGNLLIPAQPVLEAMGAEVMWQPEGGVIEASRDGVELRLIRGVPILGAGGEEVEMREAPRIEGDTLLMPPREPIEALGGELLWNRAENTLYVTSRPEADEVDEQ